MFSKQSPVISRDDAIAEGLRRYHAVVPCARGHFADRYVCNNQCVECRRQQNASHYAADPESKKARERARYADNRESIAERNRKYAAANSAAANERKKRWRQNNPEKARAQLRNWREKNPEKERALRRNCGAKRRGAPGSHTAKDIQAIKGFQKNKCAYCRVKLNKYHVDHIVPIMLGGSNDRANLQLTCAPCNHRKHWKHPIQFAQDLGRLL